MLEALTDPKWREAMVGEMQSLEKNGTWVLTTLLEGKHIVGCKWVFTLKCNPDGIIKRYKGRLVAKGFTQSYGVDHFETLSSGQT